MDDSDIPEALRPFLVEAQDIGAEIIAQAQRLGVNAETVEEWLVTFTEEIGARGAAWRFLTEESPFFDGEPRVPLDVLKEGGDMKDVLDAARSHGDSFT
jgi:hypothetical protein